MKYLTLIRHAKSSHDLTGVTDFERPLNARGLKDAPEMGRHLHAAFRFSPDVMISSPAVRALHTARAIAAEVGINEWDIREEPAIYEAPVGTLLRVVKELDEAHRHVCLVGHNPGTEILTNWLCGTQAVENVVTCSVVMLQLNIETWKEAGQGCAELKEFLYPGLLQAGSSTLEN